MTSPLFDLTFGIPTRPDSNRVAELGENELAERHVAALRAALEYLAETASVDGTDAPAR